MHDVNIMYTKQENIEMSKEDFGHGDADNTREKIFLWVFMFVLFVLIFLLFFL